MMMMMMLMLKEVNEIGEFSSGKASLS